MILREWLGRFLLRGMAPDVDEVSCGKPSDLDGMAPWPEHGFPLLSSCSCLSWVIGIHVSFRGYRDGGERALLPRQDKRSTP